MSSSNEQPRSSHRDIAKRGTGHVALFRNWDFGARSGVDEVETLFDPLKAFVDPVDPPGDTRILLLKE